MIRLEQVRLEWEENVMANVRQILENCINCSRIDKGNFCFDERPWHKLARLRHKRAYTQYRK